MSANLEQLLIYHITDVENLPGILAAGGLQSDALMTEKNRPASATATSRSGD
jgi:ssDNA thymidine ADP-ribosyltransferase, DarT